MKTLTIFLSLLVPSALLAGDETLTGDLTGTHGKFTLVTPHNPPGRKVRQEILTAHPAAPGVEKALERLSGKAVVVTGERRNGSFRVRSVKALDVSGEGGGHHH